MSGSPEGLRRNCILQVEDHVDDVFLLKHALERAEVVAPVYVARDGQEAIDYLAGTGSFADREAFPIPSLVLLDLNIPRVPGLEVLAWIRRQRALDTLTVFVLSTSDAPTHVKTANHLGANAYFTKPLKLAERVVMARQFQDWLQRAAEKHRPTSKNPGR